MEPTARAEAIAPQLLDALTMIRSCGAERPVFEPSGSTRTFTIRTRDIGEAICYPAMLRRLAQVAPGVGLRSVSLPIKETVAGLANGAIDVALGFLPALEAGIHSTPLFSQEYVCVMRSGHPAARLEMTAELFLAQEHILVENAGSGHLQLERALVRAGARHRIRVRHPQYLSAPWLLASSDLVWTAPAALAELLRRHFPLAVRPLPIDLPGFEVAVYWHDKAHQDPANKWLRGVLVDLFQSHQRPARPAARPVLAA
jgi:DNA-binding transcriptional LysR family regulator